ncbi:MAG: hypothetical protein IAE97_07835 [Chthoniobacterales bacterium]|nr:hypothetical protein [Chthoniobacterales bacterium]
MHPLVQTIVPTVLVPAAVCGVSVLAASLLPPGRWRGALVGAGAAAAWCLGVWFAVRTPRWPPMQAADWQFYAVMVAGLVALVFPWGATTAWQRGMSGFVFFAVFFVLLAHRFLAGLWPGMAAMAWPAGLAAFALLNVWAVAGVARSVQAAATCGAIMVFSVLVSAGLALGGAATLGHSAGILAAAAGAAWVVSWTLRRQMDGLPAAFAATVVLGGLLGQGVLFGGLDPAAAIWFGAAWPVAAMATRVLRHCGGKLRVGFVLGVLAGCGGVALWQIKT